jgi:hypothetical protein
MGQRCIDKFLVGRPEEKRPLERQWHKCEDNIKMDLKDGKMWTKFIWLRIGASNRLLRTR